MSVPRSIIRPAALALVTALLTGGAFARMALGNDQQAAAPVAAGAASRPVLPGVARVPLGDDIDLKNAIRTADRQAGLAVYLADDDVWLYDLEAETSQRLTANGDAAYEWDVKFRDRRTVSYATDSAIMVLDITTHAATKFADVTGLVRYAWNPAGTELAYLSATWSDSDAMTRTTVNVVTGSGSIESTPLDLVLPEGFCGVHAPDGDLAMAYSPDGRTIMIENVAAQPSPTVVLVDRDGLKQRSLHHWSWARFLPDSTIMAKEVDQWVRIAGESREPLPIPQDARNVAVTPDGTAVAFDTVGTRPQVRVVRVDDGSITTIARGAALPRWISNDSLIVFATEPCDECESWNSAGYARRFDGGERGARLPFEVPGQIDVLF